MLTEGGRWSKKVKSCKRSLWTPPCINCYISCPLPSIDQFQKNGIRTFKIAEQNATWSKWSKQHKIYCFPIFCSFGLNFSYVTQYFLRILRNNVFLSLMRKFCKIFLNFEPRKTVHLRPNQLDLSVLRFSREIKIHITVLVKCDGTFFFKTQ